MLTLNIKTVIILEKGTYQYQIFFTFLNIYSHQRWFLLTCPETRFSKSLSHLGLVSPKSRCSCSLGLGLGLKLLCLKSRSRHCSDVGKAHRCCKYLVKIVIFSKNRLSVRFLAIQAS